MKITIVSILLLVSSVCFAQNDTIYLYEHYLALNGLNYNLIENEIKTGRSIEFTVEDNTFILRLGSGENAHWHDKIYTEYRPLKNGEYNGIEILSSENAVDTINGEIIYSGNYMKVVNKIPPDKYYISGKGIYKNNRKEGKWTYLYKNRKLKKEIFYKSGIPEKGFFIYRPDETIMIQVIKINKEEWEIIKYTESGKKIDNEIKKTNEIKALF